MRLTKEQWEVVEPFIPAKEKVKTNKTRGRPWVEPRKILEGTLWVLKTGARWKDLPADYPAYQTCHRRFQQWVELGIFNEILHALVGHLRKRGDIQLDETFIDGTFVRAKKKDLKPANAPVGVAQKSWQLQTVTLFLSDLPLRMLHAMRLNSLIQQFGVDILGTYLSELWVTKHTIQIALGMTSDEISELNSLVPISRIEKKSQLKMVELYEDTEEDGVWNDFLPG